LGVGDYLVNNGIQDLFDRALFKEDGLLKVEKLRMLETKYDATPATSVFVTDTVGDVLEGHKAGLKVIAVTFGYHNRARLAKAAPEALVDSWPELVALLQDSVRINALLGK
jgi:phosphoglycolate phosphatase